MMDFTWYILGVLTGAVAYSLYVVSKKHTLNWLLWSGLIAGMSDGIPVLGFTEEVPGFVFCTGFSGHGFGLAPVIGRLMAELIMDCEVSIPIADFCYGRFVKGGDQDCSCQGNAVCASQTAVCPNKREFVKNV